MNLDQEIFKSIKGCNQGNPQDLIDIINYVDYHQKLVVSYEELSESLMSLVNN